MESKDYKELILFLSDKFSVIEGKLDQKPDKDDVDKRFTSIDERFSRVDSAFVDVLGKIEHLLETKADKTDVDRLLHNLDAYAQRADTYFQEMVMLAHKVDRHEKWLRQIAEKVGIELKGD